ncbi:hypothetical protein QYE76_068644 [Lolium multiflorum]|uniref:RNA-directed DNA polymerase n=1 Tax=Lolium multiflorum TaxID=4521 RepID=A0AAD8WE57_LOLMU|nr:hypothetical protein QYE76_068644 [Lolium multiflorum]
MASRPPPLQILAEIIDKQQEDHQSVLATLTSLADENHQARAERAEDRATLKSIAETLQKLQGDIANTDQQQRAHNLALLRLEGKGAPQLGGLGLMQAPTSTARVGVPPAMADASDRAPRLYKIDFPLFDGASDPRPWLTRCNLFFLGQRTQESDKTWLASYHLTDVAALWYGHLEAKLGQRPSWGEFQTLISKHFGPSTRANPFGGDVETCYARRRDGLAISFEHTNIVTGAATTAARPIRPSRTAASPTPAAQESAGSAPALIFRKLTPAEMDDRRAKGLCFNCDEKFVRGHRCKRTHNFIHEELATVVGLPFSSDRRLGVTVANGDRVTCCGLLKQAAITIDTESFLVDLHAIPLGGFDVVLGTRFLKTLGLSGCRFGTRTIGWSGHVLVLQAGLHTYMSARVELFSTASWPRSRTSSPSPRVYRRHAPMTIIFTSFPGQMLARGLIRHSSSMFSSHVLLVRKHDGTWHFCIDFRGLNMVTIKDKFPIPVVDELLDELKGAQFFTKLDLRSGYHQVRMAPEDIHKMAFRTHEGLFEFVVMAFGLTNAHATFQALMNDVLGPFLRRFVLVFFDDILIYSSSWSDHLLHVKLVLEAMRTHQLYLKRSKCSFGEEYMAYLGHVISAEGVAMDSDKVLVVVDWPVPHTVQAVRGFLGLAGYYRKFIKGFDTIAAPLTAPLKKDGFLSTDQVATAFEALKVAFTTAPVLQLPDFTAPFIVECDAFGSGFGAVMHQGEGPIAYFSKLIAPRHVSLAVYERELIGLVQAMRHWRPYLWGRAFIVKTDHYSLKFLLDQRLATIPQHHWVGKLLGFDFTVEYKPGRQNIVADALSRREVATGHTCAITGTSFNLFEATTPFIVECDASGSGFGVVMHQGEGPIAYFSKPIAPRHVSLAVYERELIGLVQAVRHWRPYLWGRAFIVKTDHYSLKFLLDQRLATIPQHHWVGKLLGFDFTVEYKPGRQNIVADALSRREVATGHTCAITGTCFDLFEALRQAVHTDLALVAFREQLE